MKKVKEFILAMILPRKMYRFHGMKVIYSFFIFILATFILLFSVNLSTKRFMKDMIGSIDFETTDYEVIKQDKLPNYRIAKANNGGYYLDVSEPGEEGKVDNYKGVFEILFEDSKENKIELKIVIDESLDLFIEEDAAKNIDKDLFDLSGYMSQKRADKTTYILYIFTKKAFYYLYDLGQKKDINGNYIDSANRGYGSYERDDESNYKYYLPTDEKEASTLNEYGNYDVSVWTTETTEEATIEIDGIVYKAEKKIRDELRYAIYNGEYIYNNVNIDMINAEKEAVNFGSNQDIKYVLTTSVELMSEADANMQKSMYSVLVLLINIIFPFFWVLITWLLSRKFIMNKFKEYYAICSITYFTTSFIGLILGFFIPFDSLMFILLIIELIYYIVVTFRINTDPKLLNSKDNNNDDNHSNDNHQDKPGPKQPEIVFKKIKSDDAYQVE